MSFFRVWILIVIGAVGVQAQGSGTNPNALIPVAGEDVINQNQYYVTLLKKCNDKGDVYFEFGPKPKDLGGIKQSPIAQIQVQSLSEMGKSLVLSPSQDFRGEIYDLNTTGKDKLGFQVTYLGAGSQILTSFKISVSTEKKGDVSVTDQLYHEIRNMGPQQGVAVPNPEPDIFTHFCGKKFYKVQLLAFYQDFLGLTEQQMCELQVLFQANNLVYQSNELLEWTNQYCSLLQQFWGSFVNDDPGPNDPPCRCKLIKSTTFIDHSIGNTTGSPLDPCPTVAPIESSYTYAIGGDSRMREDENWVIFTRGYMGAAKSLFAITHHFEGGDNPIPQISDTYLSVNLLKSSLSFLMKCYDPVGLKIDTACVCTKEVEFFGNYISYARGEAGTDGNFIGSGNGKVKSCMQDYAMIFKVNKNEFVPLSSGIADFCVECESTDTTNIFSSLGDVASGLEEAVTAFAGPFALDKIDDYLNAAGDVYDLVDNFFSGVKNCRDPLDTVYTLANIRDVHTLTAANNEITYFTISSIRSTIDFINDEAFSQLHVNSDYLMAAKLNSDGDSICCNELVAAYSIGNLSEFKESNTATISGNKLVFQGIDATVRSPLNNNYNRLVRGNLFETTARPLARSQKDVAVFFNPVILELVFGITCPPHCSASLDCYYNCGYWGECHDFEGNIQGNGEVASLVIIEEESELELDVTEERSNDLPTVRFKHTDVVKVYPNPTSAGRGLILELPAEEAKVYHAYEIYTINGQRTQAVGGLSFEEKQEISLQQLSQGTYILVLHRTDGNVFVEKIVVYE